MKYTAYLYILVAIVLSACLKEDDQSPTPAELYIRYYGEGGDNEVLGLLPGIDQDTWILYGTTVTDDGIRPYLIEVNPEGKQLKDNLADSIYNDLFDGVAGSVYPMKIKLDKEKNEYLMAGYYETRVSGQDVYGGFWGTVNKDNLKAELHQIDSVWIRDIVKTTESDGIDKYVLLCEASNIYQNGSLISIDRGVDIVLSKRDQDDSVYWEKNHGFSGLNTEDRGVALFEKTNGHLIVFGYTDEENEYLGKNIFTLETTERGTSDQGSVVYGFSAGNLQDEIPYAVVENNGSYAVVGEVTSADNTSSGFYLQVGADAIPYASYVINNDYELGCGLYAATLGSGNGVIAVGKIYGFTGKNDEAFLTRLSPTGREVMSDQHYGTSTGNDEAKAILSLPDGDLLIGVTVDFGSSSSANAKKMALLRLNRNGELKN